MVLFILIYLLFTLITARDFNSSVKVIRFAKGQHKVSTCITIYDDQLLEVFSVLLSVPNVTTIVPGQYVLACVTIKGMYVHMCICMCVYMRACVCV